MRKLSIIFFLVMIQLNLAAQTIQLSTNGYTIGLTRIDSIKYEEYSLDNLPKLEFRKYDSSINVMSRSFGLTYSKDIKKGVVAKPLYTTNYYKYKDGILQAPMPILFLRPVDSNTFKIKYKGLGIIEKHPNLTGFYYIFLDNRKFKTGQNVFDLCKQLSTAKAVSIVEPVYVKLLKSDNPLLPKQWNIKNNGAIMGSLRGADMNIEYIWNYATGQGIKVAVIDDGVELTHPDLQQNLLPGYDATGNGSGGGSVPNNYHGTSCAGIISSANNSIGTKGVAFAAQIIPIRMGIVNSGEFNTNDNWISSCFAEAINRGADIISNSWSGGSPSAQIDAAIENAVVNGRSGKGCVVLFSAGNLNSIVQYPATNFRVIAVGASTPCDTRKRSSSIPTEVEQNVSTDPQGISCDGEKSWGSNYGVNLDVLAPGVLIPTTDNTGTNGRTTSDYNEFFNGTSAACPNAAGVVALILSANPMLTGSQARKILESTCTKISNLSFQANVPNQPNGTWNPQAGYGRVNAAAAVCQAMGLCGTIPPAANDFAFFTFAPWGQEIAYLKNGQVVSRLGDVETILAPNAPKARVNSPLVTGGISGEQHLYYIGEDDNIHDIYQRTVNTWSFGNLNTSVKCKPNSAIAADYAYWSINGAGTLPFVFYINNDNRIGCLEYTNNNWTNTVFTKGQSPKEGTAMAMVAQDGCPVLFYIGDDNKVHGFNKWHGVWYDITPAGNQVNCRNNSPLTSGKYGVPADDANNLLEDAHCFYIGEDHKLYTIWTVKHLGGNWRVDCISESVQTGADSKLYFLRNGNDTRQSRLVYQQPDRLINYFRATPESGWINADPVRVPTDLIPDNGSPLGFKGSALFYKSNGQLLRVSPF
jgi:subtilisin family serine protease